MKDKDYNSTILNNELIYYINNKNLLNIFDLKERKLIIYNFQRLFI